MARGEYKTPGGKLVGVNVDVTTDGRVTDCHVDGDFFVDESGAADVDVDAVMSELGRGLAQGSSAAVVLSRHPRIHVIGAAPSAFDIAFARACSASHVVGREPDGSDAGTARPVAVPSGVDVDVDDHALRRMAINRWRASHIDVVRDRPRTPRDQMRYDEDFARRLAAGLERPTLRIWEWSAPAVIIGRFQSLPDEVDVATARAEGIEMVRRCTGGGAMFVEPGNTITYSLYVPMGFVQGVDIARSYRLCDQWLVDALGALGMDVRFSGLNDIASRHGKIGGAAQRRFPGRDGRPGAVLHHVTLAYDIDAEKMARVLRVSREKMSDKAVRSAVKRVDPLRSQTGMSRETLVRHLIEAAASWGYNDAESK